MGDGISRRPRAGPVGLTGTARALAGRALDLLWPPRCPGCDTPHGPAESGGFCPACAGALPRLDPPVCLRCGEPLVADAAGPCDRCRRTPPAFTIARAACRFAGPARAAIHALKFDGVRSAAAPLAALLAADFDRWPALRDGVDAVLPIPLHPVRRRGRGYDQAAMLATGLATARALPTLSGVVARARATPPQVGLDRAARLVNLTGAFTVRVPAAVAGRTLLLVDDVLTTGATADACARALLEAGAREVRVYTVARD